MRISPVSLTSAQSSFLASIDEPLLDSADSLYVVNDG